MDYPPFFIIGNPRSGTTMFRLMLHAHPDICVPPECGFALWLYDKYKNWDSRENDLSAVLQDILAAKKMNTWELEPELLTEFVKDHNPGCYRDICNLVYNFYSLSVGKSIRLWGDKNNFYIDYVPSIKELFPMSKIILIARDGRDVACSYRELNNKDILSEFMPTLPDRIEAIAREWMDNNNKVLSCFQGIDRNDVYFVQYEDLILNTRATLTAVTKFLGLEFHPDMLEYYRDSSEPEEFLQWKSKVKERPDAENIGRFKKHLTQQEIFQFEEIAGEMLRKFNYTLVAMDLPKKEKIIDSDALKF